MTNVALDIGCGNSKTPDSIGVDRIKLSGVDIIYDLSLRRLPFKNESVTKIICNDVLEHIDNIIPLMEEFHRILKTDGILEIKVPHGTSISYLSDPTHKRPFTSYSMKYFTKNHFLNYYSNATFEIVSQKFLFLPISNEFVSLNKLLISVTKFIANLKIEFFEHFLYICPLDCRIECYLKKVKT